MAIYICNGVRGVIAQQVRADLAGEITKIHCDVTGASRRSVHVFFFEDAPQLPINGKSIFLFGSIRAGRTDAQKNELSQRIKAAICTHADVSFGEITFGTTDVPPSWTMVGGEVQADLT